MNLEDVSLKGDCRLDGGYSPVDIERRSFEIIESELANPLNPKYANIIKRVIHTTADFDFADTLCFSPTALDSAFTALRNGEKIITDTNMTKSGVNKTALTRLNTEVICFMGDIDVANEARERDVTKAIVCMEKAAELGASPIISVGNAPTALIRLYELIREDKIKPSLIIGTPVGFVNVEASKELIMTAGVPYIVARGRKGGSTVAAAIINALMKEAFIVI